MPCDLPHAPIIKVCCRPCYNLLVFERANKVQATQDGTEEAIPGEDTSKMITCNKIWSVDTLQSIGSGLIFRDRDRLQCMEKFRDGEIDIDNLCNQLRAKARCSEGGAVVSTKDVDDIFGIMPMPNAPHSRRLASVTFSPHY